MFRGLINNAKSAAGSLLAKYLARVTVAVPFIIALGFATAAITLMLVDRFGAVAAYLMVAGGFTALGCLTALIVTVKEQEEEVAEQQAESSDTAGVATDAAAQAAVQAPLALIGALLSTPLGPASLASGARIVMRNIPLVVLLAVLGFLFWPSDQAGEESPGEERPSKDDEEPIRVRPNGAHPATAEAMRAEFG